MQIRKIAQPFTGRYWLFCKDCIDARVSSRDRDGRRPTRVVFLTRTPSSAHRRIHPGEPRPHETNGTRRRGSTPILRVQGPREHTHNHKMLKTAPTPGRQKGTPAYQEQHKACTSFYGTASRTSGTRPNNNVHFCTANISGTGPASSRRPDI